MPSFKPFSAVSTRHSCSLFDIRLENDFIVFRGSDHESAGQLLKGVVVLCLPHSLKVDEVRLRLNGTLRFSAHGVSGQRIDRQTSILEHKWDPFVGGPNSKTVTLPAGNYEYPFEYMLAGDTAESVEGIPEASITYRLKATVARGKLSYDLHAAKHLRIIRTLEPGALEFLHAMSVENIWPNKVDYSIVIPQKAVVFGGSVNMEMRFSPLLKGLELGDITAKMVETRDCYLYAASSTLHYKEHRTEREVATWKFETSREEHWCDMIEDTGQEGWAVTKSLNLPRKLRQCIQDLNHHGIKVRHKIKLTVALKNPDGHISELRATLPVSIFISPNMPLDEQGNLLDQAPATGADQPDMAAVAPPGYGEHVLDQLYEDVDVSGFQTPGIQSGIQSPFYGQSRTGSSENLTQLAHNDPVTPAALSSRLADVSADPHNRDVSRTTAATRSGMASPGAAQQASALHSEPPSANLSRSTSGEDENMSRRNSDDGAHFHSEFADLNKVPSYTTAVRTPARSRSWTPQNPLPDYQTAMSIPSTPPAVDMGMADGLAPISEVPGPQDASTPLQAGNSGVNRFHPDDTGNLRRLSLMQARDQAV